MNQEKYRKNALQRSLGDEEDLVPTHSRSPFILRKYIKIPKVFFASRRRRSSLLKIQEQKMSLLDQVSASSFPKD
jgi:hypothetical protein